MTFWFLLVRQISAGVVEGESNKCGGLQRDRVSRQAAEKNLTPRRKDAKKSRVKIQAVGLLQFHLSPLCFPLRLCVLA